MTVTAKKPKTENDLDESFQWHDGLDQDHIFEGELELIKKLRQQVPELEQESNKFVAVFLFARRHNIEETLALLRRFFKKKEEYSYMFPGQHTPSFKYNSFMAEHIVKGGGSMLHPKGRRDNKDRMLRYFFMGIDKPSGRTKEETYPSLFWQTYYQIETEPLSAWRNGIAIIVDLKGAGLHNIDISSSGREVHGALQGTFPFRIRAMMVINGNWIVAALLKAAKIALPKKLYDRIKLMDQSALLDLIPAKHLSQQYGGTDIVYTYKDYLEEVAKTEEELFSKGIWKAPEVLDGATPTC
jgi:hypothetical protein